MSNSNSVSIFFLFLLSFNCYNCWVFTDINYKNLDEGVNVLEDEIETDTEIILQQRLALIYPGTKWCGAGNIADNYDDLGSAKETDMCCREHDNCPDIIPAGETKYNLTNNAFYTRLSCQCDEKFRQCLHNANSTVGKQVGVIYFNGLGTQCYRQDYPVVGCKRRGGWLGRKCLEYEYNTSGEQSYQWFDVPNY